ncbi:siderophore ABC transporter substrate-binding protein [Leisingera sp.]|uniref:siderophore ABC transporter substrate-binding protein n=1 Tax=Leisingera sp. TaxID=1879318 RepID=UPI002B26E12F|nr:siderophore ABC transporter substrate-binding protein [Leisingera sp.]
MSSIKQALLAGLASLVFTGAGAEEAVVVPFSPPLVIAHSLGETVLAHRPIRVAALGMNDLDFLDQLGVPVAGVPKDFVPHFLAGYVEDPEVRDLGFIVKPDVEEVYALQPDLVLMTALQAEHYSDISTFAPVLYFDVDYRDSRRGHLQAITEHFATLGRIFGKEDIARAGIAALNAKVADLNAALAERPEKALILLHNNGAFSAFGTTSRYGFVFSDLGVVPAGGFDETGLHGQPVTSEFIQAADPDILFIIDRTAVMTNRPVLSRAYIANPLLENTPAWKNDRVVFVDPEAWYTTAAGPTSLSIIIEEIREAYARP